MGIPMTHSIVIANVDTNLPHEEIVRAAAALQRQVIEHFFPIWGVIASVRALAIGELARDDEWRLELRKVPTIEGALGFHDTTEAGLPRLFDFPELDEQDGVAWTVTGSHEILEALADPLLRRGTQDNTGTWWALEICDAVERDTYEIDGIPVSNFVTPQWGEPPTRLHGARFDYLGLCSEPWEIRSGGYGEKWNGKAWQQVGMQRNGRSTVSSLGLSRHSRRRKPLPQFQ